MTSQFNRRQFVRGGAAAVAGSVAAPLLPAADPTSACVLESRFLKYSVAPDGRSLQFIDKQTGRDYCLPNAGKLALVRKGGKEYAATSVKVNDGKLVIDFGDAGAIAVVEPKGHDRYIVLEVVAVTGEPVDELVFLDIPLTLQGKREEPFAACVLALNLKTNVSEFPRPASRLRAASYRQFGLTGAKAALIACPSGQLREVLQEVVTAAPDLPHSRLGGPWALDQPINQGSYLFNFDGVTEKNADAWIKLAKSLGMTQIDFHGGASFRFGDLRPNPATYPGGRASLKAAIDRLHAAGIAAGLHTYAFFLAKDCPWVTPVPDPRLAKDATFTLAQDLAPQNDAVPVAETTEKMSTITGFFVHNSVTLRIENELIVYTGVRKEAPFAFTGCQRGAYGTKASAHPKGAKVDHLKECFGLFVPDPDTTLFAEVAARTAETFNECGFDMIYLDALDGAGILDPYLGGSFYWHYSGRFVYEICKRLARPALMEMSSFHHHLWCVRSRFCAWDHPTRSYKKFIDLHCADNEENRRMFMPGELGWWALKSWTGAEAERTFPDDIEYLMTKCLATDTGFALMGIDPTTAAGVPALPRLASIVKRYEDLRHAKKVPESIKAKLRQPKAEFTLAGSLETGWQFSPVDYARHRVEQSGGPSSTWRATNRFGRQPLRLRIEALYSAGPYEAPGNPVLADFLSPEDFPIRSSQSTVGASWKPSREMVKAGQASGCFTLVSNHPTAKGAWAQFEKKFSPTKDLSGHQALGLWVHGDGQGEVLNLQFRNPHHIVGGIGDHYILIDFQGWRYFELIEPEGERHAEYGWPYGDIYSIYREATQFGQVETLGVWFNNLPPGKKATCFLSPIKALPLVKTKLIRPRITVGKATIALPAEIETGCCLELQSAADCKLFGPQGELIREVKLDGELPTLEPGENEIRFQCETPSGQSARAYVTVITQGEPLRA